MPGLFTLLPSSPPRPPALTFFHLSPSFRKIRMPFQSLFGTSFSKQRRQKKKGIFGEKRKERERESKRKRRGIKQSCVFSPLVTANSESLSTYYGSLLRKFLLPFIRLSVCIPNFVFPSLPLPGERQRERKQIFIIKGALSTSQSAVETNFPSLFCIFGLWSTHGRKKI